MVNLGGCLGTIDNRQAFSITLQGSETSPHPQNEPKRCLEGYALSSTTARYGKLSCRTTQPIRERTEFNDSLWEPFMCGPQQYK